MARGRPRKSGDVMLKSAEMIGWALGGLEREIAQTRERLSTLTEQAAQLRARLGRAASSAVTSTAGPDKSPGTGTGSRRKMSAEARKRIAEMMRKRWADRKKRGLNRL